MKTLAINLAAAWVANIRTYQDGDVFRESNIDLAAGDLADRFGYLKTAVDGKASLAGTNTWTGNNTFENPVVVNDYLSFGSNTAHGLVHREYNFNDANETVTTGFDTGRVPTITANRTYTLAASGDRRRIVLVRHRTADAFTVTFKDNFAVTIGVVPASQAGFIVVEFDATATPFWRPILWSSNITSLAAT